MNNVPRQKLCELLSAYGPSLCGDIRLCRALLRDACPGCDREVNVLIATIEQGVPRDLLGGPQNPSQPALAPLVCRLTDTLAMDKDAARWAMETWAQGLGRVPREGSARGTEFR